MSSPIASDRFMQLNIKNKPGNKPLSDAAKGLFGYIYAIGGK